MGRSNPMNQKQLYFLACFTLINTAIYSLNLPSWSFILASLILITAYFFITNKVANKDNNDSNQNKKQDPHMDLNTAKRVQEALLAIDPPKSDKIQISKRCLPASTLGGDFYTFVNKAVDRISRSSAQKGIIQLIDKPEKMLGITIGDVAGHGVSSALVMALTSGLLNRIGFNNRSPAIILQRANSDIRRFISQSHITHVTAFYSIINLDTMSLSYSSAGHPPAILMRNDGSHELLATDGVFLGMYPDEHFHEENIQLESGNRIVLFTDGIIEAMNEKREAYGIDRLIELTQKNMKLNTDSYSELVFNTLKKYQNGEIQRDDQTLVVMDIT